MMSSDEYAVIHAVAASCSGGFLTTIIDVTGSAYRREGTMMFFSEDNWEMGLLSGGCVEQDILARMEIEEHDRRSSFSLIYDLRSEDDLSWGQGAGCDGSITVLMEYVSSELKNNLTLVRQWLENGDTVEHIKVLDDDLNVISSVFISETGENAGNFDTHFVHSVPVNKLYSDEKTGRYYFRQTFLPQPRLIIYGAGADARPVCEIAKQAGFQVIVADWRQSYCTKEHFPHADLLVNGNPLSVLEEVHVRSSDFIVIMTHNFTKDKELMNYLLGGEYAFVGMLGSKKRADRLLGNKGKPDWFYSPVGLSINADGPEQIAISIAAQLIAVKNSNTESSKVVKS